MVAVAESDSRDPIAIINEIRTLLTQANNQYAAQDFVGVKSHFKPHTWIILNSWSVLLLH